MSAREHSSHPDQLASSGPDAGAWTLTAAPEGRVDGAPVRSAVGRPLRRRRKQRELGELHRPQWQQVLLTVLVLAAGLIFLVPIYWLFSGALKPNEEDRKSVGEGKRLN